MTPTLFLRIASILALIFCAGHTVGGVLSPPAPGVQTDVVQVMKAGSFNAMGAMRTFWDFHVGYGILITVILLVQSIFFWQLSILAKTDAPRLRPILALFALQFLANAPIAMRYFFLGPGLISVAIAACLAVAFYAAGASGSAR
jgi:hypothetical protein